MRGAGDQFSIGERIAFYRRRRGLTQGVLAGLVGRSEDWLSKIERGERDVRRLDVLAEVAQALRVTMGDLLGQPVLVEDEHNEDDNVPAIRDALMAPRRLSRVLFGRNEAAPIEVGPVQRLAEMAWSDFQRGRLGSTISALPSLIASAQQLEDAAGDLVDARAAWAVSARIHHLGASTLSKIGEADLAWMAAERAMQAADQSDDPKVLASAARAGTHALLAVGRYDDALSLGATASSWLRDRVEDDDPEALSLSGMLQLRTALAAARHQDRGTRTDLLHQASAAADRLGEDANYWQTGFGPTNVKLHELATALDLGDVAYVVEHGPDVTVDHMPVERSVAYQIDLARALSLVARDDEALPHLLDAEREAPQLVRHSAKVRETVRAMHRRAPVTAGKESALLGLAERCRAVQ
ncbi:helix-turn-helix domain-containing protein [Nocardioidaceae bacterium SCSIO 66511]|nr:helix-turn-helix domain-containing protein [Nocardioidaceae bacterium SCSIO 66511]